VSYIAVIQRVADGEIRRYPMKNDWLEIRDGIEHTDWSWWADGNYGCDCNRELSFWRAGGEPDDADTECGHSRFKVLAFELPDGTVIAGPDAESPESQKPRQ
jgi:hypothetical protein